MPIDRDRYFEAVRDDPFPGTLTQDQVEGQTFILDAWEKHVPYDDTRWLAYFLATSYHETAATMQPIEEYGKGKGQPYGKPDPTTGETYHGRGYCQITWAGNYRRIDQELKLSGDASCYLHANNALDPTIAARAGYTGMVQGWFRSGHTLPRYFSDTLDDPWTAREIINSDKKTVPSWSGGKNIGTLIAGYHDAFHGAITTAWVEREPPRQGPLPETYTRTIVISSTAPIEIRVAEAEV